MEHEVVVTGGGPTGMMLAGELALAGIDVGILERRETRQLDGSRAGGLHARTIEVLDQRGIGERFVSQGTTVQVTGFAGVTLDISDFPTRRPYGLGLWQTHIERILAEWIDELPVTVHPGREATGLVQDDDGVDIELASGERVRAQYVVGCDGGRSVIRRAAGIAFEGADPTVSSLIAEVEMAEEPEFGMRRDARGLHGMGRLDDGPVRVVVREQRLDRTAEPTLEELSAALNEVYGTDYGVHGPRWISRFTDAARQAAAYRDRRVLLAGDAAHVHSPVGGQGLNTGVQDAVNLGWKLAQVVRGTASEQLLDSYHAERHPVAARVLEMTLAQTALMPADDRTDALRGVVGGLMELDEPRRRIAGELSGLDIRYDLGEGHPLLGRRIPDLDLITADGPTRVYPLLHDARPVLLHLGGQGAIDIAPWADRVRLVDAECDGPWELPVVGPVPAPAAVVIRPDGYVAWAGDDAGAVALPDALTTWFGPPAGA
ncbi:MAG: FAD-dependent monooxygenase [Solirubrobacteraceae bacterium]|nr:FAD-dependent monooxygenase [Solirubrobacteraceae bacterium]